MPAKRHSVLDVVELTVDSGRWPTGTIGTIVEADRTIVEADPQRALVEISDDRARLNVADPDSQSSGPRVGHVAVLLHRFAK